MADASPRSLLPRRLRELPADLAGILLAVLLADLAVLLPVPGGEPLRFVGGLALVLLLPGYAVTAALFPEDGREQSGSDRAGGVDGVERVALSVGVSVAVVALVGLALAVSPVGLRTAPLLLAMSGLAVGGTVVAAVRRQRLPESERFTVPVGAWLAAGRRGFTDPDSVLDAAVNVGLVGVVLLSVASVGYAVGVPGAGETSTEFYLLAEDESGDLVAADYPRNYTVGESRPLVVGVGNREHEPVEYAVVVLLQNVTRSDGAVTGVERQVELRRFEPRVAHGETWRERYAVTPTFAGSDLRLTFLLYHGNPPAEPAVGNAAQALHLRVNVSAAE